jgi:hypothetical protein
MLTISGSNCASSGTRRVYCASQGKLRHGDEVLVHRQIHDSAGDEIPREIHRPHKTHGRIEGRQSAVDGVGNNVIDASNAIPVVLKAAVLKKCPARESRRNYDPLDENRKIDGNFLPGVVYRTPFRG